MDKIINIMLCIFHYDFLNVEERVGVILCTVKRQEWSKPKVSSCSSEKPLGGLHFLLTPFLYFPKVLSMTLWIGKKKKVLFF